MAEDQSKVMLMHLEAPCILAVGVSSWGRQGAFLSGCLENIVHSEALVKRGANEY